MRQKGQISRRGFLRLSAATVAGAAAVACVPAAPATDPATEGEDCNCGNQGLSNIEGAVRPDRKIQNAGDKVLAFHGSDAQDFFQLPRRRTGGLRV